MTSGFVTVYKQPWLDAEMGSSTAGMKLELRINGYKVSVHINTEADVDALGCDGFCYKLKYIAAELREMMKGRPQIPPRAGEKREEP